MKEYRICMPLTVEEVMFNNAAINVVVFLCLFCFVLFFNSPEQLINVRLYIFID